MINIVSKLFNIAFPCTCKICGDAIQNGYFCSNCMKGLSFIVSPKCSVCSFPFKFSDKNLDKDYLLCIKCLNKKPSFDKCISVLKYNDFAKKIILPFKHSDRTFFKYFISDLIYKYGIDIINQSDFIVPVPISFTRLLKRKYNQSALLANIISHKSDKIFLPALKRIKFIESQGHLSEQERIKNVKNCFVVKKKFIQMIQEKNILLIDDVFTTGATVNECAMVLKNNGANKVYVLTFCKVIQ